MELAVLVMDAQNALDYVTRALTLSSRALLDIATHHQQETVKTVRLCSHSDVSAIQSCVPACLVVSYACT